MVNGVCHKGISIKEEHGRKRTIGNREEQSKKHSVSCCSERTRGYKIRSKVDAEGVIRDPTELYHESNVLQVDPAVGLQWHQHHILQKMPFPKVCWISPGNPHR